MENTFIETGKKNRTYVLMFLIAILALCFFAAVSLLALSKIRPYNRQKAKPIEVQTEYVCSGGFLLKEAEVVVFDGKAVRC